MSLISQGSSVIRMLEQWMGRERFFSGISRYLRAYQYTNARTDDLWAALGEVRQYWGYALPLLLP